MKLDPAGRGTGSVDSGWDWTIAFDGTRTPVKTALFILVAIVWILPGLVGHEPWKSDEAVAMGIVHQLLQNGDWLLPMLAGEPFLERPPLYYIVAALFAKVFSPLLPVHDAARLASGFFTAVALLFTALASRTLSGERFGRAAVIILLGTLGLLLRLHEMIADTALFAAFAMGYFGFALAVSRPGWAGICLGLASGLGFLANGFTAPVLLFSIALTLPVCFSRWRVRAYLQCLILAVLIALPLLVAWPAALEQRSPALFNQWLYINNWDEWRVYLSSGSLDNAAYYLRILPWYTWPALPMAAWTLWHAGRAGLARPQIHLPLVSLVVVFAFLAVGPDAREFYALPMLIPLAGLAAAGIDTLRRGAAGALDWFGMMTFGLLSTGLWLGWIALQWGKPRPVAEWLSEYQPGFIMPFEPLTFFAAAVLSVLYVLTVTRSRRSNRRAIVNWTAGITVSWMLAMTLWLPLIDQARSYRGTMEELKRALPAQYDCVASSNLGDAQRALADYTIGLVTMRLENNQGGECHVLLVQGVANKEPALSVLWNKIWEGQRPGDKTERFRLYSRDN